MGSTAADNMLSANDDDQHKNLNLYVNYHGSLPVMVDCQSGNQYWM